MRLFYNNVIDADGVLFTPTTYDSAYPADLLANEQRSYGWKTGDTQAAENVVIDLGAAQDVTAIILLDHDLLNTDSNILIEANTSDSWGAPAFSQSLTWAASIIAQTFTVKTYRYWRLSFTKASAGVQRMIGRLFLGTYYTTTEGAATIEMDSEDLSQLQRSEGGQKWADAQDSYRTYGADFDAATNAQKAAIETFADTVGTFKSFIFQIDEGSSNADLVEKVYGKLIRKPKFKDNGFDSTGALAWDFKLELEEQL